MKIIDQIYHCQMPDPVFGVWILNCYLQIFISHTDIQTVIISDLGFELGWFNPCIVERIADKVVQEFHLNPAKLVWFEHYSSDDQDLNATDFSQVVFQWKNGKATNPQWISINSAEVQLLISETSTPVLC